VNDVAIRIRMRPFYTIPTAGNPVPNLPQQKLSKEDVEEVFRNHNDADLSRSSGQPVVFGETGDGRHLMVVYERIDIDTVYPITAYEVPRRQFP